MVRSGLFLDNLGFASFVLASGGAAVVTQGTLGLRQRTACTAAHSSCLSQARFPRWTRSPTRRRACKPSAYSCSSTPHPGQRCLYVETSAFSVHFRAGARIPGRPSQSHPTHSHPTAREHCQAAPWAPTSCPKAGQCCSVAAGVRARPSRRPVLPATPPACAFASSKQRRHHGRRRL